jgi:hypothetical protein
MAKQHARQFPLVRDVAIECRLARDALRLAIRADSAIVKPLRQTPKATTIVAEARGRGPFVEPLRIADQPKS